MAGDNRTLAIIVRRRTTGDDSWIIDTLLESGEVQAFRLPGIQKSRKRSSFYFAPGALCEIQYHSQAAQAIIPKNIELVFTPFAESQEYHRLDAVAEILKLAEFLQPAAENAGVFKLMRIFLETLPASPRETERHADRYYWEFLKLMGFAHAQEKGVSFACYDLAHGYLTDRDAAMQPDNGLRLPAAWISGALAAESGQNRSVAIRARIREFLKSI